jgi:NAD(P)-dependent dehydrogenase (short-subunit alcohol dehydrogenase family)
VSKDLFDLAGRVAVVTGGASGLGAAIAEALAQHGASIAVLDLDAQRAADVAGSLAADGFPATAKEVDVCNRRRLEAVADEICSEFGRIDILVNSAGVTYRHEAADFPEAVFDRIIDVNLKGTFLSCQAFGRKMLASGSGSIINLASIAGLVAYPGSCAYLASKGGVVQLTKGLAVEWIDRGVRVNALAPALFDTPMTRRAGQEAPVSGDFISARSLRTNDPIAQPSELAGAAVFLASDAARRVTGHVLPVDDGYVIA